MKAMIFAAGMGTRLKPLTDTIPKALVSVGNKPLLQHVIEKLKKAGFNEIIINVHHFADQIIDFIKANDSFGIRIEFSDETDKLLDTGGAIKKASWFFDDGKPFLIHNVDIFSNIDLNHLYDFHIKNDSDASVVVSKRDTFRYLLFDDDNNLSGWINDKTGESKSPLLNFNASNYNRLAFSGIHIINPTLFNQFEQFPDKFSIIDFYLTVCDTEKIYGFVPDDFKMVDVGKVDVLEDIRLQF